MGNREKFNNFAYSEEMLDTIDYMKFVVEEDFELKVITPQSLLLAMMEDSECNAAYILNRYLTINNFLGLSGSIINQMTLMNDKYHCNDDDSYDEELIAIMAQAALEAENLGLKDISTEHVLLAVLNESVNFPICTLFSKYINYNMVFNMCVQNTVEEDRQTNKLIFKKRPPMEEENDMTKYALKSSVNPSLMTESQPTAFISKYTTDITKMVEEGNCENLVNRPKYMEKMVQVLSRRKKNNIVLVGNPGVGTTSLVHLLADLISKGEVPEVLKNKHIYMLNSVALVSGTTLKGMFEERVNGLFNELTATDKNILFIDNMQTVVRNTGRDKDGDLTDILGPILTDGKVRVIGTMSFKDYRNGIENAPALSHKLQKIVVEETTTEETFEILKSVRTSYEKFHRVSFSDECLMRTIKLAKRYITGNNLPDSAIDIIDITGARLSQPETEEIKSYRLKLASIIEKKQNCLNNGEFELVDELDKEESECTKKINDLIHKNCDDKNMWYMTTEDDIDRTVASITDIPMERLKSSDKKSILHIDEVLKKDIIGQDEAINEVAKAIKRNRAGFNDKNKVYATFLLVSPTGCGKTLLAKKIAENIFGDEKALVRFDMSEYQDKTSVNKLIGSSAGYVGYDNGGLLTEAIKNKPHCVLLFDEIEKADESIYNLFLQLFDEGRLTDNNGTLVNFKNVVIIMTSNVGAKDASEFGKNVGFIDSTEEKKKSIVERSIRNKFNPEFLNRIDKIIHLNPLTEENLKEISRIELEKIISRVEEDNVHITYDDSVIDYIHGMAVLQKEYGARPIVRIIQDNISDKIVDYVLESDENEKRYHISNKDNEIEVTVI